jgi:hypothetical protein
LNWRPQRPERCALPGCATPRPGLPRRESCAGRSESIVGGVKWSDFEDAAGDLARLAREAFEEQHLAILGTLRVDGWPRISPCEVYIVDGELMLGMMPRSLKLADLRRDSRITVTNGQAERVPRRGDAKLYGRAVAVDDATLRRHFGDAQEAAIDWRPPDDVPLFTVDIESAGYVSFGPARRALRWTAAEGLIELRHPDD